MGRAAAEHIHTWAHTGPGGEKKHGREALTAHLTTSEREERGEGRLDARRCRSCRRWRRRVGRCRRTAWGGASRAAPWRTTPRWSLPPPAARPSSGPWSAGPSSPRAGGARTSGSSSTRRPSRPSSSVSPRRTTYYVA
jgi:hypothetical protein